MRKPRFLATFVVDLRFLIGNRRTMKKSYFILSLIVGVVAMLSCNGKTDEELLTQRVDSFAVHYYNWQLEKCMYQVTAESKHKLEFLASNISQADVDSLKQAETGATYEIDDITMEGRDATVKLHVFDYFEAKEIGQPLQKTDECIVTLHLVKNGNAWKVEL